MEGACELLKLWEAHEIFVACKCKVLKDATNLGRDRLAQKRWLRLLDWLSLVVLLLRHVLGLLICRIHLLVVVLGDSDMRLCLNMLVPCGALVVVGSGIIDILNRLALKRDLLMYADDWLLMILD